MATTTAPSRVDTAGIPAAFKNEPLTDFTNPEHARRMRAAIEKVRSELGREYDLIIGGRHVKTAKKHLSLIRPSRRRLSVFTRRPAWLRSSPRCRPL